MADIDTFNNLRKPGVYKIVNNLTNEFYIGSAINMKYRWKLHRRVLNNKTHHNLHLQRAWDKYGNDVFSFEVVEWVADKEKLIEVEDAYISKYFDTGVLYNIVRKSYSPMLGRKGKDCPNYGKPLSDSHRKSLSDAAKQHVHTAEQNQKISISLKKRFQDITKHPGYGTHRSAETRLLQSELKKGRPLAVGHRLQLRLARLGKKKTLVGFDIRKNKQIYKYA